MKIIYPIVESQCHFARDRSAKKMARGAFIPLNTQFLSLVIKTAEQVSWRKPFENLKIAVAGKRVPAVPCCSRSFIISGCQVPSWAHSGDSDLSNGSVWPLPASVRSCG